MGMSIDIDGSIKELSEWRKHLNYDNGDYCYGDDTTKHSLDVAIETMYKYKQIEQILDDWKSDGGTFEMSESYWLRLISEVVEDGKID